MNSIRQHHLRFKAQTILGAGRGRRLGVPTVNLDLRDVPVALKEGIYGCAVLTGKGKRLPAAMHYGPRAVFKVGIACEVHLIDHTLPSTPPSLEIEVLQFLRPVRNFDSPEELVKQIHIDIDDVRALMS